VQVAAADAHGADLDQKITRSYLWLRDVPDTHAFLPITEFL
jgi:hypothetical protein